MSSLRTSIQALADKFAAGVLAAVRSASLEEILGGAGAGGSTAPAHRGSGRPAKTGNGGQFAGIGGAGQPDPLTVSKPAKRGKGGRLARRSASDIEHVVGVIVAKLGEHKAGLRSEQLQKALRLDKREITRPIEVALEAKKISKTGKKRSTTYFAK